MCGSARVVRPTTVLATRIPVHRAARPAALPSFAGFRDPEVFDIFLAGGLCSTHLHVVVGATVLDTGLPVQRGQIPSVHTVQLAVRAQSGQPINIVELSSDTLHKQRRTCVTPVGKSSSKLAGIQPVRQPVRAADPGERAAERRHHRAERELPRRRQRRRDGAGERDRQLRAALRG